MMNSTSNTLFCMEVTQYVHIFEDTVYDVFVRTKRNLDSFAAAALRAGSVLPTLSVLQCRLSLERLLPVLQL